MNKPFFRSKNSLSKRIDTYFELNDKLPPNKETQTLPTSKKTPGGRKSWGPLTGVATFSGLVFFLGFNCLEEFVDYEQNGEFAGMLKSGRLRVQAKYESFLQTPAGAAFAIKHLLGIKTRNTATVIRNNTLNVVVHENGIPTSGSEKEVML